jgi:hypothetical protein
MALITNYVRTLIPANWKSSPSGWISGNCPMCITNGQIRPDTKGRGGFYFEDEKFQYNCFNCGFKTGWSTDKGISNRLKKLMMRFGADESDIQRLQLELMQEDQLNDLLRKQKRTQEPIEIDWPEMQLPPDTVQIGEYKGEATPEFIRAADYLVSRGFDLSSKDFLYSPSKVPGKINNRIIIPFYYRNKVVGYTARWTGQVPEGIPKYFTQQPPRKFVYGLDKQTSNKRIVIVTEGQLDAIVTDGIAIGSNNCNDEQADIIDSLNKRIIVLPDADKSSMRLIAKAIKRGWEVSFPEWDGCKDAADALMRYGRLATIRSIIDSAIDNSIKIQVLAKGYCR